MYRYISIFILIITAFTGCAFLKTPLPEPSSEGANAYKKACGVCHALADPRRSTFTQWRHLVGVMEQRMAEREMPPMTTKEKGLILDYLKKHSRL